MPDGPLSMAFDDPELMRNLGMPASPITASGQDPDEVRARMPLNGQAAQPSSAQAAGAYGGALPMPPSQSPTDPNDVARQAMTQQLSAGNKLMQAGDQMQDDPAISASQQKLAADRAAMPNASDPQYKPSFGTRVLRGLRGAGLGLAEHGIFGMGVGAIDPALIPGGKAYGAPNDAYDAAAGAQQKTIAADTQQQDDLLANFKRSQDALKARQGAYNEGGQTFDKAATAANTAADLPNKTTTANADLMKAQADAQRVALETPEAKDAAQKALIATRTNQANMDPMLKKPGYLRTRYILTGEFQPQHDLNSADVEQAQVTKLTAAYIAEHNGKKPGFEDLQKIYAAVGGKADLASDKEAGMNARADQRVAAAEVKSLEAEKSKYGIMWLAADKADWDARYNAAKARLATAEGAATAPAGQTAAPPTATQPPAPNAEPMVRLQLPALPGQTAPRYARFPQSKVEAAKKAGAVEVPPQ